MVRVTRHPGGLAKDGQIVSKCYGIEGSYRPQPTNGLSLEQSIQLEMAYDVIPFTTSSATPGIQTTNALTISLQNFSGTSSLLAVFDQYRIDQLEVWTETSVTYSGVNFPEVTTAVDLDDNSTSFTKGALMDHQGSVSSSAVAGHYHKWRPHIAVASYSGAFTSYTNIPSTWIDSASPAVQHYGLKIATTSTGTAVPITAIVRAVISFRAPVIN